MEKFRSRIDNGVNQVGYRWLSIGTIHTLPIIRAAFRLLRFGARRIVAVQVLVDREGKPWYVGEFYDFDDIAVGIPEVGAARPPADRLRRCVKPHSGRLEPFVDRVDILHVEREMGEPVIRGGPVRVRGLGRG